MTNISDDDMVLVSDNIMKSCRDKMEAVLFVGEVLKNYDEIYALTITIKREKSADFFVYTVTVSLSGGIEKTKLSGTAARLITSNALRGYSFLTEGSEENESGKKRNDTRKRM